MMASFETVVRPVVFPDIRPQAPRSLPPDDDSSGMVIRGNPAKSFDLSYSYSFNASSNSNRETEREVDTMRIYQHDNHDNYIDVDVATRVNKRGPRGFASGTDPSFGDSSQNEMWREKYRKPEESENIEYRSSKTVSNNP
jgi:hypothetical protein